MHMNKYINSHFSKAQTKVRATRQFRHKKSQSVNEMASEINSQQMLTFYKESTLGQETNPTERRMIEESLGEEEIKEELAVFGQDTVDQKNNETPCFNKIPMKVTGVSTSCFGGNNNLSSFEF